MAKVSYYTEKGLKELKEKLSYLVEVERPKASQALADARDKGDLSENAEYDAAKEAQQKLENKINELEAVVAEARIIDESKMDLSKALIHSNVKIKNKKNGREMTYKLVSQSESNIKAGKISIDSPIGQGLLGKEVGDEAEVKVPNGTVTFEILDIHRD